MTIEPAESLVSIDVLVHNRDITWSLAEGRGGSRTGHVMQMRRSERRKQTIDLLVDLLDYSADVVQTATDLEKTIDREGQALYERLLQIVGHELFDLLFVGVLRDEVTEAFRRVRLGQVDRCRIKLCFTGDDAEWLSKLPWEYARTPPGDDRLDLKGIFLSGLAELLLTRRLVHRYFKNLKIETWPAHVLLVCSSPPYHEGNELERIEAVRVVEQLEQLERKGIIRLKKLVEPPPDVRTEDYRATVTLAEFSSVAYSFKPAIIHFIGHGHCSDGKGELAFAKDEGTVDWVTDDEFVRVANGCKQLKLVFLQACKSALPDPYVGFSGVARTLAASGLPAVVGMQYRITSSAANTFAAAFYEALLDDRLPISFAVQAARRTLDAERGDDRLSFGLPVLYLSDDAILAPPPDPTAVEGELVPPRPQRPGGVSREDVPAPIGSCPRCKAALATAEQKVCQNCALRLRCPNPGCGVRYLDPTKDHYCHGCAEPVRQAPFSEDAVETVAAVTDTMPARAATLAVLGLDAGDR